MDDDQEDSPERAEARWWMLVPLSGCALLGFLWDSTFLAFFGGLCLGAFLAVQAFQRWGDPRLMKGPTHG